MKPPFDFTACRIESPPPKTRGPVTRFLYEVFEVDRPVLRQMEQPGFPWYTWQPYVLVRQGDVLGHVALLPMTVWLAGRLEPVVGVASVATHPEFRHRGVARYLLEYCMKEIDRHSVAAVLFTDRPEVYEKHGFRDVPQEYCGVGTARLDALDGQFACTTHQVLDEQILAAVRHVYETECPDYSGKLVREDGYWPLYGVLFSCFERPRILACSSHGRVIGYLRLESQRDRLLVSEFCCAAEEGAVIATLLSGARDYAVELDLRWITLAVPKAHFVWQWLAEREIGFAAEPPGGEHETFMIRGVQGRWDDRWGALQWSLADKF